MRLCRFCFVPCALYHMPLLHGRPSSCCVLHAQCGAHGHSTRLEQRDRALAAANEEKALAERENRALVERVEELDAKIKRRDDALAKAASTAEAQEAELLKIREEARVLREEREASRQEAEQAHAACASLRAKLAEREGRLAGVMSRVQGTTASPFGDVSNLQPAAASPSAAAARLAYARHGGPMARGLPPPDGARRRAAHARRPARGSTGTRVSK